MDKRGAEGRRVRGDGRGVRVSEVSRGVNKPEKRYIAEVKNAKNNEEMSCTKKGKICILRRNGVKCVRYHY